ncbi:MAG: presenilin family intramembrane aspartyl protease PSH [Thermoplasmata archaeon]
MRATRWLGLLGLYVGAQSLALALALPFRSAGFSGGASGGESLIGPVLLIAAVVVVPVVLLALSRRAGIVPALRWLMLLAIGGALYLTLVETFLLLLPQGFLVPPYPAGTVLFPGVTVGASLAVALFLALLLEPQWYVVDAAGFVSAAAVIAILGGSFAILPVFVLLIALAVYDYVAVYRTRHMLRLADLAVEMKLPILLVMPEEAGFDYPASGSLSEMRTVPPDERQALFMGLGDVVIPGVLVASAFVWLPATASLGGLPGSLWVAVGAMLGSLAGYALLMSRVLRGNAQAGLPFLNTGAIVGYLIAYLAVFHGAGLFGLSGAL